MNEIKNTKINAISPNFPLLASYSNKYQVRHAPSYPSCVKQFNDQRFGNNREAPTFMQLPNLTDNKHTYLNTYIEKSREYEKNVKNNEPLTRRMEISKDNLKILGSYLNKQGINTSKSLEKSMSSDKVYVDNLNISPKYLKNLNDFNIAETYRINEDRQLKFQKKSSKRFDCLTDQITEIKPGTMSVDKWSKFYENYITISEKDTGFKFQKGYFTDFADHQKLTIDLNKHLMKDNVTKEKRIYGESPKKVNKRYISQRKESLEKRKKKTLEVVDKNNLYKLKSYLIKSGVLD